MQRRDISPESSSGGLARNRQQSWRALLRYWPTFFIACLVIVLAGSLEGLYRELRLERERDMVKFELETIRSGLDRYLFDATELGRQTANLLERAGSASTEQFEEIGRRLFPSVPETSFLSWAPDLVVTAAYRPTGWEPLIGQDLREVSVRGNGLEGALLASDVLSEGPERDQQGRVMLLQHFPVKQHDGERVQLLGAVTVGVSLQDALSEYGLADSGTRIDLAISVGGQSGGLENVVLGESAIQSNNPAFARVVTAGGGKFTLLAIPKGGWNKETADSTKVRVVLFGLCLLIIGMALHSNRQSMRRQAASLAQQAAESRLWGVVRNLPGAAYTYRMPPGNEAPGPADRINFVNKDACREIWGLEAADVEADSMLIAELVDDPAALEEISAKIQASVRSLHPWHAVWPIRTPEGTRKWLDGRGHPLRREDGATLWFSMVFDATEQVRRDRELERQTELSHQAQKQQSIGQLTGGVAHDFNNRLAVIMGNLELLRDEESDAERIRMIDAGINATRRGADLTRSMLAFARKARLAPSPIALNSLVTDTRNWAGRTLPERIEIETSLPTGLWTIEADHASTEAALLNLIVNARDAMPEGGKLTIETANVRIDPAYDESHHQNLAPGRYVMLAVSDTGQGIAAENLDKIFEPFFTTKPPGAGSGLGLSMVLGFMEQSGGSVQVHSEPGQGTTFKLYFPARHVAAVPVDETDEIVEVSPDHSVRILLAEDEPDVRAVLARAIRKSGYVVSEAASGDEALVIFQSDPGFDLLVTDIVMPGKLQGTDLGRALRELRPDLPVVFMSGYAREAIVHGNGLHPEDIRLMKPVHRVDLLNAISKALETKGTDQEP